ncbi:hypothetical protein FHS27_004918 [Rhodopirellula rubra]|uniref:Cytochrome c-552/4 domain-containing protein n=1 Tax=Aporhodopirellula rubra TaxID=980271 RepID=A0A7W5E3C7_9BACT|nr:multiheme c-type cytochrome [Aporhodopirellula rubra]MBB3209082.1 hypothetical protein [Aporhodopirellula rubra]
MASKNALVFREDDETTIAVLPHLFVFVPKKPATISLPPISIRIVIASALLAGMVAWAVLNAASVSISNQEFVRNSPPGGSANRTNRHEVHAVNPDRRLRVENLPPRAQQSLFAWRNFVSNTFAGDQACAECHAAEYAAHQRSGHSRTLTLMPQSDLASTLSNQGVYKDSRREQQFTFTATEDTFVVRDDSNAPGVAVPVTWLLGSGTHAQTPIAVDEITQKGVELRWSSFPRHDATRPSEIGLTPDHERFDDFQQGSIECFGRPLDSSDIRACLGCHSTVTSPPSLPIMESMVIANVGCERCHGPRKDHVDLANQGLAEQAKPRLKYENAESYMNTCAACHRDETSVHPSATPDELARFQPYGIKRSRCYLESPGHLTCSTCHDPHDTVSHDRASSIAQCQRCHGNPDHGSGYYRSADHDAATFADAPQAVCTHEPTGDCIECHMPAVPWSEGISFHDHWIRIP